MRQPATVQSGRSASVGVRALAIVVSLLLGLPLAGCASPLPPCRRDGALDTFTPGEHSLKLCVDGQQRTTTLVVPANATSPAPLLLMLHGGGGNGEQMRRDDGMDPVAADLGFIIAYPEGTPARRGSDVRTWNAMHCCGKAYAERSPDVAFLAELVATVQAAWPIDASRTGVAGHSNGAMMAYRFAAERSDLVSHVAAVAGAIGGEPDPGDPVRRIPPPAEPVSALILHARDDPRVPYGGGQGQNLDGPRVDLSVDAAVDFWVQANAATRSEAPAREDGVAEQRFAGMRGTQVRVLSTEGGHGWPGIDDGRTRSPAAPDAALEIGAFLVGVARVPA